MSPYKPNPYKPNQKSDKPQNEEVEYASIGTPIPNNAKLGDVVEELRHLQKEYKELCNKVNSLVSESKKILDDIKEIKINV